MAATVILRPQAAFVFALEEGGREFELPAVSSCGFDDVAAFKQINDLTGDPVRQGEVCKNFILKWAPGVQDELTRLHLGEQVFFSIFTAYNRSQELGESQALRRSSQSTARP